MKTKHLNDTQFRALIQHCTTRRPDNPDNAAILFYLLAVTAIRADELVSCTFGSINHDTNTLTVRASKGSHDRSLTLPNTLMRLISAFTNKNACMEFATYSLMYLLNPRYHDANKVKSKRHASKQLLRDKWRTLTESIGADGISLHGLRHTVAVKAVKAGMQLNEVQAILGHRRLSSTEHYLGYVNSQQAQEKVLTMLGCGDIEIKETA